MVMVLPAKACRMVLMPLIRVARSPEVNWRKNETGSFQRSYCPLSFVSMCANVENSELIKVLPELKSINDPKVKNVSCATPDACLSKGCNYTLVKLEENDYEILFNLEKGSGQYNEGGCYKVTPDGISKK